MYSLERRIFFNSIKCNAICFKTTSVRRKWEGVVGLEVHAQLQSNSKLFSGAGTTFIETVNNQVSFFDAAIPGTLPVLNKECVRKGVLSALALNCTVHPVSWFDRKHYFYADLPAGYQITQQRAPFATDGFLEFQVITPETAKTPYLKTSKIKQIQLEQDSGKSLHDSDANMSLVDLNRAGYPLIEIVFEPDLKDGEEAACLVKELILILRQLETCSCKIEEGALRVDANISVRKVGDTTLGVRSEVKNIGGIRNINRAVNYEILRQKKLLSGGKSIINETRSWDAENGYTVSMRDKEIQQDYRFMPEPNLPPLRVSLIDCDNSNAINVPLLQKQLPELPAIVRQNLVNKYGLQMVNVLRLLNEPVLLNHFLCITQDYPKMEIMKVWNFLMMDVLSILNKNKLHAEECKLNSKDLGQLINLLYDGIVNRIIAARILEKLIFEREDSPLEMVDKNKWFQINDASLLEESCRLVIEYNPELIEDYFKAKKQKHKDENFQKILVEVIRNTDERANMVLTKKILQTVLDGIKK